MHICSCQCNRYSAEHIKQNLLFAHRSAREQWDSHGSQYHISTGLSSMFHSASLIKRNLLSHYPLHPFLTKPILFFFTSICILSPKIQNMLYFYILKIYINFILKKSYWDTVDLQCRVISDVLQSESVMHIHICTLF